MRANVENVCAAHPDRFDCPDCLIHYGAQTGGYGLIVHDGGSSMIAISYCPWCSAKLSNGSETIQ
jgi:hypothetical protein